MCSGGARISTHCDAAFDLWNGSIATAATAENQQQEPVGLAPNDEQKVAEAAVVALCAQIVKDHREVHMLFLCQHKAVEICLGTNEETGKALNMPGVESALL